MRFEHWEGKKKIGQNISAEDQATLKIDLEKLTDRAY